MLLSKNCESSRIADLRPIGPSLADKLTCLPIKGYRLGQSVPGAPTGMPFFLPGSLVSSRPIEEVPPLMTDKASEAPVASAADGHRGPYYCAMGTWVQRGGIHATSLGAPVLSKMETRCCTPRQHLSESWVRSWWWANHAYRAGFYSLLSCFSTPMQVWKW
jgi:hypothetical protein